MDQLVPQPDEKAHNVLDLGILDLRDHRWFGKHKHLRMRLRVIHLRLTHHPIEIDDQSIQVGPQSFCVEVAEVGDVRAEALDNLDDETIDPCIQPRDVVIVRLNRVRHHCVLQGKDLESLAKQLRHFFMSHPVLLQ
ncbi:hypothetical protein ES703_81562 [subsurface metagenome]